MNINAHITITASSIADLTAVANALSVLGAKVELQPSAPIYAPAAEGTIASAQAPAPDVAAIVVTTIGQVNIGDEVHWKGSKYEFDGVVEKVSAGAASAESKGVWVRRKDTGALVSLTVGDLARYGLTIGNTTATPAQAVPAPVDNRITAAADAVVGQAIHWAGQKYDFDGKVIGTYPRDTKCVFLRRNDTGKKVSLTADDLLTGSLTRI